MSVGLTSVLDLHIAPPFEDSYTIPSITQLSAVSLRWAPNVIVGKKNIGLDRDSNPGPEEYRPCTLPLSYQTTC